MASLTHPQMIHEMQQAIAEEIKEAGQKAYKHTATNGKETSNQPGQHIYIFTLSELWEPQDDMPLKIKFSGSQDIKGTVVTSTGTTITIATNKPLPSEALDKIILEDDATELLERLKEALETNQDDQEGPALLGSKSFKVNQHRPKSASRAISLAFGQKFSPDPSQRRAIEHALGSEVTFIVGPPGTGKTATLAAIAFTYLQEGCSLLIAAHTNIAIDNAIMRLADICKDTGKIEELNAGRIVRYGTPQLKEQMQSEYSEVYSQAIIKRRSGALQSQREQVQKQIDQLTEELQQAQERKKPWLENRQSRLEQLKEHKQELHSLEQREQQRIKQLNAHRNDLLAQQLSVQQEIKRCQDHIAQYVAQQTRWETQKAQLQSQESSLQASLAEAQQANMLKRFSKRLNPQKLALQLGEIKYQLNQCQSQINQIEARLFQDWHPRRSQAESQLAQINAQIQSAERQLQQPPPEASSINQLRASVALCEQKIEEANARIATLQFGNVTDYLEQLREQRATLDKQLADIEKNIVAEARVVATTLSKTYMNKNLRERRFDVVILDEVSMASLPAVYIAAARADRAMIAIGDPQQLAPICSADNVEIAKKWLGRDLFELNNITLQDAERGLNSSVLLTEQSRMHPEISRVAKIHVYQGAIHDSERIKKSRQEYAQIKPLPEKRLVLCDTSDYSPIALRVPGGSHQNTYHALCSFNLACQVLATLPPSARPLQDGEFRVGIVTPYKSQAALLQGMLKDAGLEKIIRVGTVHRFQGLEAEAIIFDTVESLPLKPPFHLTSNSLGDAMRLVNVAITRPQQKLIIVANLEYIKNYFDPKDTLRLAVQEAAQNGVIQSADVLKETIPLLPEVIRTSNIDIQGPLDDRSFYNHFLHDLRQAKKRVTIFSPFLGWGRIPEMLSELKDQIRRGVRIETVYSTKREADSAKEKKSYQDLASLLQEAQIKVHYRTEMHEKFVFIDEEITYIGSLNVLSHFGTTDYMFRLQSSSLTAKIKKDWQVERILARPEKEGSIISVFVKNLPLKGGICPDCNQELIRKVIYKYNSVFYGCPNYPDCRYKDDVSTIHLEKISQLTSTPCENCGGTTRIETVRKDAWLVCAATPSCDYGQPIKIKF